MTTRVGSLELILGCMFSGKSTELIRRIRLHKLLGKRVLVVTHASDTRYSSTARVVSHDHVGEDAALSLTRLVDLFDVEAYRLNDVDSIFIEEGQFFADVEEVVTQLLSEPYHKHVVVSALDGDYCRRPFTNVTNLVCMAENVLKLNALCLLCRDGTPGVFSMRLPSSAQDDRILVGGSDMYASVCRRHYKIHANP